MISPKINMEYYYIQKRKKMLTQVTSGKTLILGVYWVYKQKLVNINSYMSCEISTAGPGILNFQYMWLLIKKALQVYG